MQTFKNYSKHFIIAALTLSIIGGAFAQVSIPTGLTNAVQYIMQTVWTDDGTDTGLVNVQVDDTNIYVRTGFLADGTGWNSKALGLDNSGNVVYVNANAINTPFFNLAGNYIPKINQAGDDLELSSMFQGTLGDISVGHINPLAKMHIQGDFRVDTVSGSLMQYTYTTGGTQVIGAVTAPDPSQLCNCDTTSNALNCGAPSFTTGVVQGNSQGFCVDITASGGGLRNYWVYMQNTTNINQGAFIVTGNRAGVMTLTPQATLDVNGNLKIANIPLNGAPTQVLVRGANGEVQYAPFPSGSAGEINTASNIGGGIGIFSSKVGVDLQLRTIIGAGMTQVTQQGNTVQINTPAQTLSLAGNTLSISSGNSVNLPVGSSSNGWNLTGNTGTNPFSNFIGTTDNQLLAFRVNNLLIGSLYPNGGIRRGINNTLQLSANNATIVGGTNNSIGANAHNSAIGGGGSNTITAGQNLTIAGGYQNTINVVGDSATIGGGKSNQIGGNYATIGGGRGNIGSGVSSFIGGGYQNIASGNNSTIAGGQDNRASGLYSTIGGGTENRSTNQRSTVGGGYGNTGGSIGSTVAGGVGNSAIGSHSTIPGGWNNRASGAYSFAAGQNAIASGTNSFVWDDGSSNIVIGSSWQPGSSFNKEFMVNADRVIIGDIENANLIYRGFGYIGGTFDTYLPGVVGIDQARTTNLLAVNATFTNTPIITSDQRLKTNIVTGSLRGTNALNMINSLNPITYQRDNNAYTANINIDRGETHYGLIAQEVNALYPELTKTIDKESIGYTGSIDGGDFIGVKYIEIIPILIQAIKEQQIMIDGLQSQIDAL